MFGWPCWRHCDRASVLRKGGVCCLMVEQLLDFWDFRFNRDADAKTR